MGACESCIGFDRCRFEYAVELRTSRVENDAADLDPTADGYTALLTALAHGIQVDLFAYRVEARENNCPSPEINNDPDYPGKNLL